MDWPGQVDEERAIAVNSLLKSFGGTAGISVDRTRLHEAEEGWIPMHLVIEPLLRQYRATRLHIQQTGKATPCQEPLQLFHPRALAPEDPYQ